MCDHDHLCGRCDVDAAKPLRALVWKVVRTQFAATDPVQMHIFLGVVREAWAGVVVFVSIRAITQRRSWKIAVKLGFGPIRVCTTAGQSVTSRLIPSYCQNNRAILECARKFVVPVTLHTFRSFFRYRTARKISHTLVRVGSKGN